MAFNEISIFGGILTVVVPGNFIVYPKPLPPNLPTGNWLGNFGLIQITNFNKLFTSNIQNRAQKPSLSVKLGEVAPYQILVIDDDSKDLYYFDGTSKKRLPNQSKVSRNNQWYRIGTLNIGDPPIAWE